MEELLQLTGYRFHQLCEFPLPQGVGEECEPLTFSQVEWPAPCPQLAVGGSGVGTQTLFHALCTTAH